jgi:AcrR family transcriptional regulator
LLDLCFERGLASMTVADLCARAEVDEADFHARYADLEDCFCDFYEEERDTVYAAIVEATEGVETWRDRMHATCYALYRTLARDERIVKFATTEVNVSGERARRLQLEGVIAVLERLDEGRAADERGAALSRGTAEAIAGVILTQLAGSAEKGGLPPEEIVIPRMMYLGLLPYLGREVAREELDIPPPPKADR